MKKGLLRRTLPLMLVLTAGCMAPQGANQGGGGGAIGTPTPSPTVSPRSEGIPENQP
jgi:hypothetical protein